MIKFVIAIIIVGFLWLSFILFGGNGQASPQEFVISAGQGVNQISANLFEQKLIKNKLAFETWLWLNKEEGKLVAGHYEIPANVSLLDLIDLLLIGPEDSQNYFTIIEGWNRESDKFHQSLEAHGFSVEDFLALTADKKNWQEQFTFLQDAPAGASLEGYIFPDTYNIDGSSDVADLVTKALENFDRKLTAKMRADILKQNKTIFEVVTLASIVEREASQRNEADTDDNMVADVFLKRLSIGMALQSDATVNFVTGKSLARPSLDDLEIDSPYNTYKYPGLPPGPIANPGLTSIEAVVYPQTNPYYFYLNTPEGDFIYAENHDQHVANKQKYLNN